MFEPGWLLDGRYRFVERLGAGGMAEVWLAEDTRLEREVAVKVLRERDEGLARRLRRESRVLAGLSHPAVVAVLDAGEVDGRPFVVLERVRGETLAELLLRDGALAPGQVASLGAELADGLAHAHTLGVVHRDVKPSNILVDEHGRARLVDFGIARTDDATHLTGTGLSIGTAAYLAPEQLDAPEQVGPPADVYALGLVLAEALSGRRVFPGPAPAAALARLRTDPPLPDVGGAWSHLLRAMTRRDPSSRPTAAAVAVAVPLPASGAAAVAGADVAADAAAATTPAVSDTDAEIAAVATTLAASDPAAETAAFAATRAVSEAGAFATTPLAATPGAGHAGRLTGRRDRRRLWLATAVVLAVLGLGMMVALVARAGDGGDPIDDRSVPAIAPATIAPAPVTTAPVVTVASTPTTVLSPPTSTATTNPITTSPTTTRPGHDPKPPKPHGGGHGHDR